MFTNTTYLQLKLLFAAILLIVAQSLLLMHQVDSSQHTVSENCEICLHAGNLGHTHNANITPLFSAIALPVAPPSSETTSFHVFSYTFFRVRGPPVIS